MSTKLTEDSGEQASADLSTALEEKLDAMAAAIESAATGRHVTEQAELQQAYERLADRASDAERPKVESSFAAQRDELQRLQGLELDIARNAVDSARQLQQGGPDEQRQALDQLEGAVDSIGGLHQQEHERLAADRAELDAVLTTQDEDERGAVLDELVTRQQTQARDVWSETELSDRLAVGSSTNLQAAEPSSDELDIANTQKRGNLGERLAADWLAENGYENLNYKPDIKETNRRGIDIVALKDDTLYLIDNKALTREGNVNSVSALTKNLDWNVDDVKRSLLETADKLKDLPEQLANIEKALDLLDKKQYVLAVTNANVAPDDRILSGITDKLGEQGLEFMDVMNGESAERLRRIADDLTAKGFDLVAAALDTEDRNRQRIDMVAMKDDRVYLIDNNAISPSGDIASVSALTRDFEDTDAREGELTKTKRALEEMAQDASRPAEEIARLKAALEAIEEERYVRAVTTANVRSETAVSEEVASTLRDEHRIVLLDLFEADEARRQEAERLKGEKAHEVRVGASRDEKEDA